MIVLEKKHLRRCRCYYESVWPKLTIQTWILDLQRYSAKLISSYQVYQGTAKVLQDSHNGYKDVAALGQALDHLQVCLQSPVKWSRTGCANVLVWTCKLVGDC